MATLPAAEATCAHCGVRISDPTPSVVHGGSTYCCANCAAAMEQTGRGSDPRSPRREGDLRCEHCSAPIVDERTLEVHGDRSFCCANCATASA